MIDTLTIYTFNYFFIVKPKSSPKSKSQIQVPNPFPNSKSRGKGLGLKLTLQILQDKSITFHHLLCLLSSPCLISGPLSLQAGIDRANQSASCPADWIDKWEVKATCLSYFTGEISSARARVNRDLFLSRYQAQLAQIFSNT